jgi:hypothetical protein
MTKLRSNLPLRIAGLAAGLVLAASFLLAWRVPASDGRLGADLRLVALVPGELTAAPNDFFLSARGMKPGEVPKSGVLRVRNITTGPVDVRVKALPSDRQLARVAQIELRSGARVLARGSVADLRRPSRPMRIPLGAVRSLRAKVWIPRSARHGYEARFADVTLDLRTHVLKGSR